MKKAILLLSILLLSAFSGCSKCVPKIITKEKYIKSKKVKYANLDKIKDCVMEKEIHFGDLNATIFWVAKIKMVECSNIAMQRKDKNLFYERQHKENR